MIPLNQAAYSIRGHLFISSADRNFFKKKISHLSSCAEFSTRPTNFFFFSSHCRCFASWDNFATFAFYYYYYTLSYPQLFDQPIRAQNQSPKIDELYIHFPQDLVKKPLIASLTNPGPVIYNNHQICCKLQKISHFKN